MKFLYTDLLELLLVFFLFVVVFVCVCVSGIAFLCCEQNIKLNFTAIFND